MDAKQACDKLNGFNFQNRYLVGANLSAFPSLKPVRKRTADQNSSIIPPARKDGSLERGPRRTPAELRKPQAPARHRITRGETHGAHGHGAGGYGAKGCGSHIDGSYRYREGENGWNDHIEGTGEGAEEPGEREFGVAARSTAVYEVCWDGVERVGLITWASFSGCGK